MTIPNLIATILQTLLDIGEARLVQGLPADLQRMVNAYEPIRGLM